MFLLSEQSLESLQKELQVSDKLSFLQQCKMRALIDNSEMSSIEILNENTVKMNNIIIESWERDFALSNGGITDNQKIAVGDAESSDLEVDCESEDYIPHKLCSSAEVTSTQIDNFVAEESDYIFDCSYVPSGTTTTSSSLKPLEGGSSIQSTSSIYYDDIEPFELAD